MLEPKVLFVTDLEGDVHGGIRIATRLARERVATLVLLHVVPLEATEGSLLAAVDLASGQLDEQLGRLAPSEQGVPFVHALEAGDPEDRIAEFAERERVELIVIEARPRHFFARVLGKGLVERLTERVRCPIVTYRAGTQPPTALPARPAAAGVVRATAEALSAILDARVGSLSTYLHVQGETARCIAHARSIRDAVGSLERAPGGRNDVFLAKIRRLLTLELGEHLRALGAIGVEVTSGDRTLVRLGLDARRDAAHADFMATLRARDGAVSVPLEATVAEPGAGQETAYVVLAGARVPTLDDAHLVFTFDARRDFLRILAQPGPTPSTETYAFDAQGWMLSNSRFPGQLRRVGLLPQDARVQTPRRLRICDPGGNLLAGEGSIAAALPLTRMAAAATLGQDGSDWTGYRDYRGVEVVGAWRWLADRGFGVAAEMDRAPA